MPTSLALAHDSDPACWTWRRRKLHLPGFLEQLKDPKLRASATEDEWREEALFYIGSWQNGRCAICGRSTSPRAERRVDRLVVDHSRATGLVRGYLCSGCNSTEGRHNVKRPIYARYREKNPATIIGLEIPYKSSWGRLTAPEEHRTQLSAQLHHCADKFRTLDAAGLITPEVKELMTEMRQIAAAALRTA
ncbi:endonuclease domain-containing protein [Streptomyces sp. NPDC059913]|uniref:endonuclease domain-containing protein n=1 Tax=unclassified Streptomyces TaxID=2593676 RepID=UPI00364F255F